MLKRESLYELCNSCGADRNDDRIAEQSECGNAFSSLRVPPSAYMEIPVWAYATGILGTAACICNIICYEKMKIFTATLFLLIGQIVFGIAADVLFWGDLPVPKLLGILVVSAGIFLDKKMAVRK